jgi:hypothetical protein
MWPSSSWCLEAASFYLDLGKSINERSFRALFGGPSSAIQYLYFWILQKCPEIPNWWGLTAYFLTLHWMKNPASSVKAFSLLHDVSENTLMRYIQITLELIHRTLPE